MKFVLASGSPRRRQLLSELGFKFIIYPSDIDETVLKGESAIKYVRRVCKQKAISVEEKARLSSKNNWVILSADTIVIFRNTILGKPKSRSEAVQMLSKLSGKTHQVVTGFCLIGIKNGKRITHIGHVRTKVRFSKRDRKFWQWYVSTGEPMDKAGAYAAQGVGMSFIEEVQGSYSNVIGLPMTQVLQSLKTYFGFDLRGNR